MKLDYLNSIPYEKKFGERKFGEKKLVKSKIISSEPYCNKLIPKNEKDDDEVNLYIYCDFNKFID